MYCIGTPNLQQLLNALKTSENWFMFGAMLGIPVSQLRKIELHHQKDPDRCKLELLQYWLDNTLVPTWNEIVQALEKTDQLALAAQIKRDYLWSSAVSEEEGMYKCVFVRQTLPLLCVGVSKIALESSPATPPSSHSSASFYSHLLQNMASTCVRIRDCFNQLLVELYVELLQFALLLLLLLTYT